MTVFFLFKFKEKVGKKILLLLVLGRLNQAIKLMSRQFFKHLPNVGTDVPKKSLNLFKPKSKKKYFRVKNEK